MIIGLLLIAAALSLTAYNIFDNIRAGSEARGVLDKLIPQMETDPAPAEGRMRYRTTENGKRFEDEIEYPDYVLNPNMDMPVKTIDGHDYIGVISLPAEGQDFPVFSKWSYPNLKTAPCRYAGSAYLDNMIICAHNYKRHFGQIKNLAYGDAIRFTDTDGNVFNYKVIETETLGRKDVDRLQGGDWDLTLFTCTIGGATRVTVRCERV